MIHRPLHNTVREWIIFVTRLDQRISTPRIAGLFPSLKRSLPFGTRTRGDTKSRTDMINKRCFVFALHSGEQTFLPQSSTSSGNRSTTRREFFDSSGGTSLVGEVSVGLCIIVDPRLTRNLNARQGIRLRAFFFEEQAIARSLIATFGLGHLRRNAESGGAALKADLLLVWGLDSLFTRGIYNLRRLFDRHRTVLLIVDSINHAGAFISLSEVNAIQSRLKVHAF